MTNRSKPTIVERIIWSLFGIGTLIVGPMIVIAPHVR